MKIKWLPCVVIMGIFFSNCTKDPLENLTAEESRIYITNYDTTVNFTAYTTFSISDSVAVIENNQLKAHERTSIDAQFIDALADALTRRGFTRVGHSQSPDLGVAISRITNSSTQLVSYPNYGNYYGGFWDPFYWGYPGYSYYFPTYYGVYETNETALGVDMVDLKNAFQNNQLKAIWSGLIRGSGIFSSRNVVSQVDALMNQSPYLEN